MGVEAFEALAAEARRGEARAAARAAWARERMAALEQAHKDSQAAWDRFFDAHPDWDEDDGLDYPDMPDGAAENAIHAEVWAAAMHDRWPRHLYWKDV